VTGPARRLRARRAGPTQPCTKCPLRLLTIVATNTQATANPYLLQQESTETATALLMQPHCTPHPPGRASSRCHKISSLLAGNPVTSAAWHMRASCAAVERPCTHDPCLNTTPQHQPAPLTSFCRKSWDSRCTATARLLCRPRGAMMSRIAAVSAAMAASGVGHRSSSFQNTRRTCRSTHSTARPGELLGHNFSMSLIAARALGER
jgi:hypothetical protein